MGRSRAEDGGGATLLPREEWAKPRGRKSNRRRCGSGDRGAAVLWPDQPKERPWVARRTASSGEVVANLKAPAQEGRHTGRRDGGLGVQKGRIVFRQSEHTKPLHRLLDGRIEHRLSNHSNEGRSPPRSGRRSEPRTVLQLGDEGGGVISASGRAAATQSASEPSLPWGRARPTAGRIAPGEQRR